MCIDVESDGLLPYINAGLGASQEWTPKNKWHLKVAFRVKYYEIREDDLTADPHRYMVQLPLRLADG